MDNLSIEAVCEKLSQGKITAKRFENDLLRIIFGEKPEESLAKLNSKLASQSKGPCIGIIPKGSSYISCRTCCSLDSSFYCEPCFQKSNHQGHFYSTENSEGEAFCNCGDPTHIRPEGFCTSHDDSNPNKVPEDFPDDLKHKIETNLERLMIKAVIILENIAEVKDLWKIADAKAPVYTIINFISQLSCSNVHIRLIVLQVLILTKKSSVMMKHRCEDLNHLSFNDTPRECHCSLLEVFCRYSFLIEDNTTSTSMSQILLYGVRLTDNRFSFLETILKMGKLYLQVHDSEGKSSLMLSKTFLRVYCVLENTEDAARFILSNKYLDQFNERVRTIFDNYFDNVSMDIQGYAIGHFVTFFQIVLSAIQTRQTIELIPNTQIFETIACLFYNFSKHHELPSTKSDETNTTLIGFRLISLFAFFEVLKKFREKAEIGGIVQLNVLEKVMLNYVQKYFCHKSKDELTPNNLLLQAYGLLIIQNKISQNFDWTNIHKIKEDKDIAEILPSLVSNLVRHLGFYSEIMNEFWVRYSLPPMAMERYENLRGGDIDLTPLQLFIACHDDASTDVFQVMASNFSPFLKKEWLETPELVTKTDAKEYNLFVDFLGLVVRLIVDVTSITKLTFDDPFLDQKCLENPILLERVNLGVVYILQTFGTLQCEMIGPLIPPCCESVAPYICENGTLVKAKLKTKYKDVCETFIFEKHKLWRGIVADKIAKNQEKTFDTIIGMPPPHKDALALQLIGTLINSSLVRYVTQILLCLQQLHDKHEVVRCAVKLYYTFLDALPDHAAVSNVDLSKIVPLLVNAELTRSLSESLSSKPLKWLTPQLQRLLDKIQETAITLGISEVFSYLEKEKDSLATLERQESSSIQSSRLKKEEMQAAFRARQEQLMRRPSQSEENVLNEESEVCGVCREQFNKTSGEVGFTLRILSRDDISYFERRMIEKFKNTSLPSFLQSFRRCSTLIFSGCFHKFHIKCFEEYKAGYVSRQPVGQMNSLCPCPACKRLVQSLKQFSEPKNRNNSIKVYSFQTLRYIIRKELHDRRPASLKYIFMLKAYLPLIFKRVQKSYQGYQEMSNKISSIYKKEFHSRFLHFKYSLMWQDGLDFSTFIKENVKVYQGMGMFFNKEFAQASNILIELKIECLRILNSLSIDKNSETDILYRLEQQWCLFSPSNNIGRYSLRPFEAMDHKDILANNLHELYTSFMVSVLTFLPDLDIKSVNSVLLVHIFGLFALQNFISHCGINNYPISQFEEFERFISVYGNQKEVELRFLKYLRTAVVIEVMFENSDPELEQAVISSNFVTEQEELEFLSKVCDLPDLLEVIQVMKPVLINKLEAHLSDTRNASSKVMKMLLSKEQWVCDFITLPDSYEEFVMTYSGRPCGLCRTTATNSLFTICMMCGLGFCVNLCPTNQENDIKNYLKHISSQHGTCGVMVAVPIGLTIMIDNLLVNESIYLYTDSFGRAPGFHNTLKLDFSKYKLNHANLEKVRDIYFRSLIPDSIPTQ